MSSSIHTKLGDGRRVAIPYDLCQRYHLEPGDPIVLEAEEAGIVMRPWHDVIREVQNYFAGAAPADVLLSEELIRDRRREVAKESDA